MELNELPLRMMRIGRSTPSNAGVDWLEALCVPSYIEKKYVSPEDRADAYDGAFTAFHIYSHLAGGDADARDMCFCEVLEWYNREGQKNLKGPFHDGLRTALCACGLEKFYKEAIDYIIANSGVLQ